MSHVSYHMNAISHGIYHVIYVKYITWYISYQFKMVYTGNCMLYTIRVYHGISQCMVYHSMVYTMYGISHSIYHTKYVISQLHITCVISHMWYDAFCMWYTMVYTIHGIYQYGISQFGMVYHSFLWYIPHPNLPNWSN